MLGTVNDAIGPFVETACDLCSKLSVTARAQGRRLCYPCIVKAPKFHFLSRAFKVALQQGYDQATFAIEKQKLLEAAHPPLSPADLAWVEDMMTAKGFV